MNKRGLGRGLGALIPETTALSNKEGDTVLSIDVDSIAANPFQPRSEFGEEDIQALAQSIREQGLLQPVVVRRRGDDTYELIAGERRLRAVRVAGFGRIPAILRESRDEEMLPLALVENVMRQDLNPIEEAEGYRRLHDEAGWTQEEIAQEVGRSRVHVANTMRLLKLPRDIQDEIAQGALTAGHARSLLTCESEEEIRELRERILSLNLNVREAEAHVATRRAQPAEPGDRKEKRARRRQGRPISPEIRDLAERLQRLYGTAVQIHERGGRGRVSLEFYTLDDLDRLLELLFAAEAKSPLGTMG
jgi:ParB family chromosome partitioning protein